MSIAKPIWLVCLGFSLLLGCSRQAWATDQADFGPVYDQFKLTLAPGNRTEILGPLYYQEHREAAKSWAAPPLFSYTRNEEIPFEEFDFLYPLLTYDRFGSEYRFQIFQLFNFAGGQTLSETNVDRFTLFPIYFQQRSAIPEKNYTALLPIHGRLQNRFFRDEVQFTLLPLYVKTRKRDAVTENYLYPVFHRRYGPGLRGWQVWPLVGQEHRDVTTRTNSWDELETVPGHDRFFALWPIFFNQRMGIGTDNPEKQQALLPLYSYLRSPLRDSTTAPWPLGVTYTVDRAKKYTEWGFPWPLVVFRRGETSTIKRVWPFYSRAHTEFLESNFYLWPIYKYNRATSAPLDRHRTRILLFLYSDLIERNTETGAALHRTDFWPLFTRRRDFNGHQSLQVLSILEPLLPNNKSVERNYSPLWSLWRAQKNPATGESSQSLLWNLYRHETGPEQKKCSLLFGLFKYQSGPGGRQWRVFYIPFGEKRKAVAAEPSHP